MPHENGSTTPSTPAAATAASTALPPSRRTSIAVCVARGSTLAAEPPQPSAVGVFGGAALLGSLAYSAVGHRFPRRQTFVFSFLLAALPYLGLALLAPTFWGLALFPVAVLLVLWGAILPEERFLHERFGTPYDEYARRVRRWL